jgi:tetratricopeptide (TPR) repeat protein
VFIRVYLWLNLLWPEFFWRETMTRENLLFGIIGILFGFIVGFMFASNMSQRMAAPVTASRGQGMPSDHPPVGSSAPSNPQAMQAEVTAQLEKARNEPTNFEAQLKAAELYYQIQRYDQSIEYLLKANQLRPDDFQTIVNLGLVNLDAGDSLKTRNQDADASKKYEAAEKWYRAASIKKPDDVVVLAGLSAATLGKGDAKAAEQAIAKLEKADPNNEDLPRFRDRLAILKKQ